MFMVYAVFFSFFPFSMPKLCSGGSKTSVVVDSLPTDRDLITHRDNIVETILAVDTLGHL